MAQALQVMFENIEPEESPNSYGVSFLQNLFNPTPTVPLSTFTLAALPSMPADRAAVSYFEAHGCNEIVAAPNSHSNWIYSVLFPRLYTMLNGPKGAGGEAFVYDFVYHSLLRLSLVHRGNMETDPAKANEYRSMALQHRRTALYAALKARVGYPEETWRTERYLYDHFSKSR